jgi:hypothetical protein
MINIPTYEEFSELNEKKYEISVESSHLTDINYDDETETLEVEFLNGSRYRYYKVPKSVFREFADEKTFLGKIGSSIKRLFVKDKSTYGKRFWQLIRRGDYRHRKIR